MNWLISIWNRLKTPRTIDSSNNLEIDLEQEKAAARLLIQSGIEFHLNYSAHGRTKNDEKAYSHRILSSDGISIWSSGEGFRTGREAKKALGKRLEGCKVLLRAPDLDSAGKRVGEKILTVRVTKDGNYSATITVVGGTYCDSTESSSLRHLLAYKGSKWLS